MKDAQSVALTGRTFVSGALADIYPSRALDPKRVQSGDMKLWCHLRKGARVWSGQFRAAIYDGRKWRTFRLNIVADSDVRYDSYDERTDKARRCFEAIAKVKGYSARKFDSTWGCTFTRAVETPTKQEGDADAAKETMAQSTGKPAAQPADTAMATTTAVQPTPAPAQAAALTARQPATATSSQARTRPARGRRKSKVADGQLTLF